MSLSSDFIRTPIFDKILATINAGMTDFSTRQSPLSMYETIMPSAQTIKSDSGAIEVLPAYTVDLLNTAIAKYKKYPLRILFSADHHKPERLDNLTVDAVFNHPYKLDISDRKKLPNTDPLLKSWAYGVICAHVLGWKGRRQGNALITPRDSLPLTEMHLRRCQQAILRARKETGIAPVDMQTGQPVVTDKKRVISSMIATPGSTPAVNTSTPSGINLQLIRDNRGILKSVLKEFNVQFEKQFKREPSRAEKETLRPLYVEYKTLKVFIPDDDDDDKPSKLTARDKRTSSAMGSGKQTATESEAAILAKVAQVRTTVDEAYKLLQRAVPTDQPRLKQFKREVQKCLFELKEQYEGTHTEVNAYKARTGKYPGDLTSKWSQNCVDTYHMLYSAYEKIKRRLEV